VTQGRGSYHRVHGGAAGQARYSSVVGRSSRRRCRRSSEPSAVARRTSLSSARRASARPVHRRGRSPGDRARRYYDSRQLSVRRRWRTTVRADCRRPSRARPGRSRRHLGRRRRFVGPDLARIAPVLCPRGETPVWRVHDPTFGPASSLEPAIAPVEHTGLVLIKSASSSPAMVVAQGGARVGFCHTTVRRLRKRRAPRPARAFRSTRQSRIRRVLARRGGGRDLPRVLIGSMTVRPPGPMSGEHAFARVSPDALPDLSPGTRPVTPTGATDRW
jgi:hypothetical protein